MATMREVAQHAGVSVTTVSHVLNGTRFVSGDLKDRVTAAIEKLNYQPDHRARSLRRGRSEIIAVIVSDIGNTFFSTIVRGIEDRLLESGYGVLLCNTGEDASVEERNVAMMLEQRVDGLVVAPTLM
ncbi:LacI family transcriptional regulator, partial [Candidatus Bipolaricaulota bacterium]|nr:LacI family transcriptional regulator [Candidatus Bipolaricaulota bacterium]